MSTRRVLRSVTSNFLGSYTSRYSDRDGYWLFGFLSATPALDIDLLGDAARSGDEPSEDARIFAIEAFDDQLIKAGLSKDRLRTARLAIATSSTPVERLAGGNVRTGREMSFAVVVETDRGVGYTVFCKKFVAPHDPTLEGRSARTDRRNG
jgi:hypothetical protein